jgi:hypothetical protein
MEQHTWLSKEVTLWSDIPELGFRKKMDLIFLTYDSPAAVRVSGEVHAPRH